MSVQTVLPRPEFQSEQKLVCLAIHQAVLFPAEHSEQERFELPKQAERLERVAGSELVADSVLVDLYYRQEHTDNFAVSAVVPESAEPAAEPAVPKDCCLHWSVSDHIDETLPMH